MLPARNILIFLPLTLFEEIFSLDLQMQLVGRWLAERNKTKTKTKTKTLLMLTSTIPWSR